MRKKICLWVIFGILTCASMLQAGTMKTIEVVPMGHYAGNGSEISAYDALSQRMFITMGEEGVDVVDISNPADPDFLFTIDVSAYGNAATHVAVYDGLVAVAVAQEPVQNPGVVAFFDMDGSPLNQVTVGSLPDMVTFTPSGDFVLVANEGEPNGDYDNDPEGSVSVIDLRNGVMNPIVNCADFKAFNSAVLDPGIRIFGPGATVAQDSEPEYIAVSTNSQTAYVTLQENNAIAIIDIRTATVTELKGLGFKNHNVTGNSLDPSNEDGGINIKNWPVFGTYQPDAIDFYQTNGKQYVVTANEGDARDYDAFSEEVRIKDIVLDPTSFPTASDLQKKSKLGRLKVTNTMGDMDDDGDYDRLYSFGARSFSIWDANGTLVYDSGNDFEVKTSQLVPQIFNADEEEFPPKVDDRSDDKGPEPEGLSVGKAFGRYYAFIGLERTGGVMVYEITNPQAPLFVEYVNTNFNGGGEFTGQDIAPEGLQFIPGEDSPTGNPLLIVTHEVSKTTVILEIRQGS